MLLIEKDEFLWCMLSVAPVVLSLGLSHGEAFHALTPQFFVLPPELGMAMHLLRVSYFSTEGF